MIRRPPISTLTDTLFPDTTLCRSPADHMKRSKGHMVPLSDAALAVLAKAAAFRMGESDVVFPGMAGKPMSDMTLLKVLRDMSEPYHVHGFRSAFTDWAANEGFADAVVEAALAHKTPDAVQAAYRRTRSEEHTSELQSLMRISYA